MNKRITLTICLFCYGTLMEKGCADEIMFNKRGGSPFFIHSDKREIFV